MFMESEKDKMKGVDDNGGLVDFFSKCTDSSSSSSVNGGVLPSSSRQSPTSGFYSSAFLPSNYSRSSSFSGVNGGGSSSDDFPPTQTPFTLQIQTPDNSPFLCNKLFTDQSLASSSGFVNNHNPSSYKTEKQCSMLYEQPLSEKLCKMKLSDEHKSNDFANINKFQGNPNGFRANNGNIVHDSGGFTSPFQKSQVEWIVNDGSFLHCNVEKFNPSQDLNNGHFVHDSRWFSSPLHYAQMGCANVGSTLPRNRSEDTAGIHMESPVPQYQFDDLYNDPLFYQNEMYHHLLEQKKEQWKNYFYNGGAQLHNPSAMYDNDSMYKTSNRSIPNWEVPRSYSHMNRVPNREGFGCEDSYTMQEHFLNHVNKNGGDRLKGKGLKKNSTHRTECLKRENQTQFGVPYEKFSSPNYRCDPTGLPPWDGMHYSIYNLAKDQNGCRLLQKMLDENGTFYDKKVNMIFEELIYHSVELMTNPFGNYLMQKVFEKCSDEQRARITDMVTAVPGQLIKISRNTHGTRSVQALIATLKTKPQIFSVVSALAPGFLDLIKDINGNHVVLGCLTSFSIEHNKGIFDVTIRFCAEIGTHRNGCRILIKCLEISSGGIRNALVTKISANAMLLTQDSFGNYVVQEVILNIPSEYALITSQLKGNYVYLSTQKFSSHVVELCLKRIVDSRPVIISELMSVSHFEQMLQHPFANYVIESALEVTKGPLHAMLIQKIRQYTTLRSSPYCKKIFKRNVLRK